MPTQNKVSDDLSEVDIDDTVQNEVDSKVEHLQSITDFDSQPIVIYVISDKRSPESDKFSRTHQHNIHDNNDAESQCHYVSGLITLFIGCMLLS